MNDFLVNKFVFKAKFKILNYFAFNSFQKLILFIKNNFIYSYLQDSHMDPDEDRQKKQMFLKTEILDRGYDGYTFQEFLNAKKPEGVPKITFPLLI